MTPKEQGEAASEVSPVFRERISSLIDEQRELLDALDE